MKTLCLEKYTWFNFIFVVCLYVNLSIFCNSHQFDGKNKLFFNLVKKLDFLNFMCYFTFTYFTLLLCMQCFIDGPYGTASREIFETEHAVLISAGIGVTPMASILQSIAHIYKESTKECPRCHHSFYSPVSDCGTNLKKVNLPPSLFKNTCIQAENRRYRAEILPIRRKTLSNQSIQP